MGPAETRIFFPLNVAIDNKYSFKKTTMSSGSFILPLPSKPLANSPSSGSMICIPLLVSVLRLSCVDSFLNISKSIAGATKTGALQDKNVAKKKLSALPVTRFEIV